MNKSNTQDPSSTDQFLKKKTILSLSHTYTLTYNHSTYQSFCKKHAITRGIIMFTFYCDFWVLLTYDILIILICFLVPTRKAVKHKHLEVPHLPEYNTKFFYQFINIKMCQSPYMVKYALYSCFLENLMPLRKAVSHSGQYGTDVQSHLIT